MYSAFWKSIALAGVIGAGCFVVYQVHLRLPDPEAELAFTPLDQSDPATSDDAPGSTAPESDPLSADAPTESGPPAQSEPNIDSLFGATPSYSPDPVADEPHSDPLGTPDYQATRPTERATGEMEPAYLADVREDENATSPPVTPASSGNPWEFDFVVTDEEAAAMSADSSTAVLPADDSGDLSSPGPTITPVSAEVADDAPWNSQPARAERSAPAPLPFDFGGEPQPVTASAENRAPRPMVLGAPEPAGSDAGAVQPTSGTTAVQPAPETADPFNPFGSIAAESPAAGDSAEADAPVVDGNETNPNTDPEPITLFGDSPATTPQPSPTPNRAAPAVSENPFAAFGPPPGDEPEAAAEPEPADEPAPTLLLPPRDDAVVESVDATEPSPAVSPSPAPTEFPETNPTFAADPPTSREPEALILPADGPAEIPLDRPAPEPIDLSPEPAALEMRTADPFAVDGAPEPGPASTATIPEPSQEPEPVAELVGDGTPGDLPPGPQQPELKVEKIAPGEATIGEPLIYSIRISNVGNSAARDVVVEDRIPRGTTLDGTIPQAELKDNRLVWRLGTMESGQEELIRIRVVPTQAGEIGSVATVRFVAEIGSTTRITAPELKLEMSGPEEVIVGEQAAFHFVIRNTGAGTARDVYIRNILPDGLQHPGGQDIEYEIGTMGPGEVREIDLNVQAATRGQQTSRAVVSVGTLEQAEAETVLNVIESRLLIERQGPPRRIVGRVANYTTTVTNRSSRTLTNVDIVEELPEGLELAAVPAGGRFDRAARRVTWTIATLNPGESRILQTSVIPQTTGRLEAIVAASDSEGNQARVASPLEVAGFSSLAVDFGHDGRPVAVGESVALRMTVKNRGTAAAEQVQALFEIPEGMRFVEARGPVQYEQQGDTVRFATVDSIDAEGEESFDIVLTAAEAGVTRVTAQLAAPNLPEPLRHDEAIVVEADDPATP